MTEPDFSKIETAGCPAGDAGRDMILRMNREHGPLRAWGFARVPVGRSVLDVGCGAGAALRELAEALPKTEAAQRAVLPFLQLSDDVPLYGIRGRLYKGS